MLDLEKKLEDAKVRRQQIVDELNAVSERRVQLMTNTIQVDEEVRLLEALIEEVKG